MSSSKVWLASAALVLASVAPAAAQKNAPPAPSVATAQQSYETLYQRYLDDARRVPDRNGAWMTDLFLDTRARRANDLLTISIVESLNASGAADANVSKASKADVSLPSPLSKALNKVVPNSASSDFKGAGATTRVTTMTATMTVRVTDVLPNGDLVVEGIREIEINSERQLVVLTGVVRQVDISTANVVSSNAVGQLRIQCVGRGLSRDSLSPGWLVRILNKIF